MTRSLNLRHRRLLPRSVYLALLAALVVAEYPLNVSVFQVFALSKLETVITASGVGIAIVGLAHLVGLILARLGKVPDRRRAGVELAIGVTFMFVLVASVVSLGLVRAAYLDALQRQVDVGVTLSRGVLFSITLIQLAIVVAAIGASFFVHNDEADELERAARADRRAARREARVEQKLLTIERSFVRAQTNRDVKRLKFLEASAASTAWYDFLRWERRSANVRHHIEGPRPDFVHAEFAPIGPGAWMTQQFELHRLAGDEAQSDTPMTADPCPIRPPRRFRLTKSRSRRGARTHEE